MEAEQRAIVAALGARMSAVRRGRGLTQDEVAELAGIDVQAVRRAESGRSTLPLHRLARVAQVLGVGMADLFAFETPIPASCVDPQEARLVAAFRALPTDRRAWVVRLARALEDELTEDETHQP